MVQHLAIRITDIHHQISNNKHSPDNNSLKLKIDKKVDQILEWQTYWNNIEWKFLKWFHKKCSKKNQESKPMRLLQRERSKVETGFVAANNYVIQLLQRVSEELGESETILRFLAADMVPTGQQQSESQPTKEEGEPKADPVMILQPRERRVFYVPTFAGFMTPKEIQELIFVTNREPRPAEQEVTTQFADGNELDQTTSILSLFCYSDTSSIFVIRLGTYTSTKFGKNGSRQ